MSYSDVNPPTRRTAKSPARRTGRATLVLLALLAGCGKSSDLPAVYPASGRVLMAGQPVVGAEVLFSSATGGTRSARGTTDDLGRYQLHTFFGPGKDAAGALPGKYQVTVRKQARVSGRINPEAGERPPANELPERFANPRTSTLSATVEANQANEFDFELAQR